MVNSYARLSVVKSDYGISGTSKDAELLRLIPDVSRAVDNEVRRRFYSEIATRYFDTTGKADLWFPTPTPDVLTVTTLKVDEDGDGVYELTLTENTDFWLWPYNETPKMRAIINPASGAISRFPNGRRRVELVGECGYSSETELTGATVDDNPLTDSATVINVAVGGGLLVDVGETLVLESEQVHVSSIATDALTVVRGVNGTTAASHVQTTVVSRRRYEGPIERAVTMQTIRFLRDQQTGASGEVGSNEVGGFSFTTLYPAIRDMIAPYRVLDAA